jgi:DNA repair protein RecN (Recombination protein N)
MLAANPGAPLLPLSRVASGGELARAMLALRLVLTGAGDDAERRTTENRTTENRTLVFDEVDAGIGGAAAVAVGEALAALGADHQVLVVTHLPQVAALARAQVVVTKEVDEGQTFATAGALDGERRVDELARMLSGSTDDAALEHARELLRPK